MLPTLKSLMMGSLLALSLILSAQQTDCDPQIQLVDVEVNSESGFVKLKLLARGADCDAMVTLGRKDIEVTEQVGNKEPKKVEVVTLDPQLDYDTLDLNEETIDVLFLVDVSRQGQVAASSEMIRAFLQKYRGINASYSLRTFSDKLEEVQPLDPENPQVILAKLRNRQTEPHLYGALIDLFHDLEEKPNKQLLFVFSKGVNVQPDYGNQPRLPPRPEDVFQAVEELGDNLYLFTVASSSGAGSGGDAGTTFNMLSELPARTVRTDDGYAVGRLPNAVEDIFGNNRKLLASHVVNIRSNDPLFMGRERRYTVSDVNDPSGEASFRSISKGSFNEPIHLGSNQGFQAYLLPTLIGLALVGGLLAVFYFVIPLIRRRRFRQVHVQPYAPRSGRQVLDPMTREPIPPGEPVVNICSMVVPLRTWRDCGDQCPHYPGCTNNNLQCDGSGRGQSLNFFALHGLNRRLNWIWFGTLGGFAGWILYALLRGLGEQSINEVVTGLTGYDNATSLIGDALLGACFGLGLTLFLTIMAERSESRRMSVRRILLRTLIGGVAATAAFTVGFLLLESGITRSPILAAAVAWVMFGVALGLVLSLRSTIEVKRGVIGGVLAGVAGFAVFTLFGRWLSGDLEAKVVSLLVTGAILGFVLDTVVKLAENYEIEYITPSNYRRRVPLSKWLKNEWAIMIGTQPGSQVYVKWPDEEVLPEHAQIRLDGGRVYLVPQGETLVNGHIISDQKRTQLENGDLIQLGRRGLTQMRFWER